MDAVEIEALPEEERRWEVAEYAGPHEGLEYTKWQIGWDGDVLFLDVIEFPSDVDDAPRVEDIARFPIAEHHVSSWLHTLTQAEYLSSRREEDDYPDDWILPINAAEAPRRGYPVVRLVRVPGTRQMSLQIRDAKDRETVESVQFWDHTPFEFKDAFMQIIEELDLSPTFRSVSEAEVEEEKKRAETVEEIFPDPDDGDHLDS